MVQSAGERALRAEPAELRAVNAELRRGQVRLIDQVEALTEARGLLVEQARLLAEENRLLRERLAELERRLGQHPRNSHRPPSTEGYAKPAARSLRERTDRRSGGQPGHSGATLRQVAVPDERVLHRPAGCAGCGRSLAEAPVVEAQRRQVFDLPELRLRVTEHVLARCRCGCGRTTTAPAPVGVDAPVHYGPGVRGLACYLLVGQHLPLARVAELFDQVLDAPVCEGSLVAWAVVAADGLAGFDAALAEALAAAAVLEADETGIRVTGRTRWVHTTRTHALTRYTVSFRRGAVAMREAGVLSRLAPDTMLVHDFWAAYWDFDVVHAVCGAHLRRELAAAAEQAGQAAWAKAIDGLLCEPNTTAHTARAAGRSALDTGLLAERQRRYAQLITAGWAANPAHRPGQRFKRRRPPMSTCSIGSTPTARRCCASPPICGCRSPTTAANKTSAP